tara:strand:+ start:6834 stop:7424 length:591 start_codon:yes stop_codon:yes gene_type:complete
MDLISYDKECNYLDLRMRNADGMLDKCIKDKNNVLSGNTCNLSNSELNSINEETMKNMNQNMHMLFVDNNLSNKTEQPLNISLDMNTDDIFISKDFSKDNNLDIYPKEKEDNVFSIILNESGDNVPDKNIVQEENRDIEDYVINNINSALMEESLNIRNDLNVNNNNNTNQDNSFYPENLTINNININTTLNENLE